MDIVISLISDLKFLLASSSNQQVKKETRPHNRDQVSSLKLAR